MRKARTRTEETEVEHGPLARYLVPASERTSFEELTDALGRVRGLPADLVDATAALLVVLVPPPAVERDVDEGDDWRKLASSAKQILANRGLEGDADAVARALDDPGAAGREVRTLLRVRDAYERRAFARRIWWVCEPPPGARDFDAPVTAASDDASHPGMIVAPDDGLTSYERVVASVRALLLEQRQRGALVDEVAACVLRLVGLTSRGRSPTAESVRATAKKLVTRKGRPKHVAPSWREHAAVLRDIGAFLPRRIASE